MDNTNGSNKTLIEDLRKRLLSRGPELSEFHENDIDRVQNDDFYVSLFLNHKCNDVEKALEMMVDCFKWRKAFGVNDLNERNIDRQLFEIGFLYPRNKDKNGNSLLLFHTKLFKKELYDLKEVKKLFAFGLEKMYINNPEVKITFIFNMQDTGLSNMDMDLIKFVVTCFQTYFPSMLEYLIVFETPWILTAAWKIVKTWLSTELISKIKFAKRAEINQYVEQDQLLTSMGGTDEFVYSYPPQLFSQKSSNPNSPMMRNKYMESLLPPNKGDMFSSMSISVEATNRLKSQDEFGYPKENRDIEESLTESAQVKIIEPDDKNSSKKDLRIRKNKIETTGPLVTISPASELTFCGPSNTRELLQIITITNTVSTPVAFKVKTTSPESFRVRPSSGPIPPGGSVEVHVNLQPGHEASVTKDKFLILSTVIPDSEKHDLSRMWKNVPKSSIMEQRLRCRYDCSGQQTTDSDRDSSDSARRTSAYDPLVIISKHLLDFDNKIDKIKTKVTRLERDLKLIFRLLIVLVFFCILTLITGVVFLSKDFFYQRWS